MGNDFYKHRMMISSKGKGKSAGARIISYIKVIEGTVYLSAIYDKSEKENFLDEELTRLYKQITDI